MKNKFYAQYLCGIITEAQYHEIEMTGGGSSLLTPEDIDELVEVAQNLVSLFQRRKKDLDAILSNDHANTAFTARSIYGNFGGSLQEFIRQLNVVLTHTPEGYLSQRHIVDIKSPEALKNMAIMAKRINSDLDSLNKYMDDCLKIAKQNPQTTRDHPVGDNAQRIIANIIKALSAHHSR